jgi:hypothetical protein
MFGDFNPYRVLTPMLSFLGWMITIRFNLRNPYSNTAYYCLVDTHWIPLIDGLRTFTWTHRIGIFRSLRAMEIKPLWFSHPFSRCLTYLIVPFFTSTYTGGENSSTSIVGSPSVSLTRLFCIVCLNFCRYLLSSHNSAAASQTDFTGRNRYFRQASAC